MDKATEVFANATAPYNPTSKASGGGSTIGGNAQIVAFEVAVSKLIRWFMRWENRSVLNLIAVHSVSQAMLGGFSGFFGDVTYMRELPSNFDALKDGAKGIPGLIVAQYVVNTAAQGLHFPRMSFRDMLITGASKAITRPLINLAYSNLGATIQGNFHAHDQMVNQQQAVARFGGQ